MCFYPLMLLCSVSSEPMETSGTKVDANVGKTQAKRAIV